MPDRIGASWDGPRYTVNDLVRQPTWVRNLVLDMMDQQFIGDALLRRGPSAVSGAVAFRTPEALFADQDAEIVSEFGEIPGIETSRGGIMTKVTTKRGLAIKISQEMRDRNETGVLQDQMRKVRNTFRRTWDKVFMDSVYGDVSGTATTDGTTSTGIPTIASGAGWDPSTATSIRQDLADAMYQIMSAYYGDDPDNKYGYEPDVLVLNQEVLPWFLDNDEVNKVMAGSPLADEQLRYTGRMPTKFFGLNVLRSWQVPVGTAMVMQRGMLGFISDERPMSGTPMYEDRPRETWRSDFTRSSVVGIDNPEAACIITGIGA